MEDESEESEQGYEGLVLRRTYLWSGVKRREKGISTKEHAPVIKNCLTYIQAWILSGQAGKEATPWPDDTKPWLNDQIRKIWIDIAERLGTPVHDSRYKVGSILTPHEARQVSNKTRPRPGE